MPKGAVVINAVLISAIITFVHILDDNDAARATGAIRKDLLH